MTNPPSILSPFDLHIFRDLFALFYSPARDSQFFDYFNVYQFKTGGGVNHICSDSVENLNG